MSHVSRTAYRIFVKFIFFFALEVYCVGARNCKCGSTHLTGMNAVYAVAYSNIILYGFSERKSQSPNVKTKRKKEKNNNLFLVYSEIQKLFDCVICHCNFSPFFLFFSFSFVSLVHFSFATL